MYIVIELQTIASGQVANQVWAFDERSQAEAKYHSVLAVAATSQIPCHSCVILQNDGMCIACEAYKHGDSVA